MDERKNAILFIAQKHASQTHANNVPVTHHLTRVSECLSYFLKLNREGTEQERNLIILAALGHDVLEDTDATPEEVKKVFGEEGFNLIWGMTNEWGDDDVLPYVKKVATGSEEVRLIKLADLADNISSVAYNLSVLGIGWVTSYFLPVVAPMREAVKKTSFVRYKKTAEALVDLIDVNYMVLLEELSRFNKSGLS